MFGVNDPSQAIVNFENFDPSQLLTALTYGGGMLLIGMLTVFSVLCLLWIFLALFKVVFHDLPAKKSAEPKVAAPVIPVQETVTYTPADTEIVAVLAAAVAMAESESSGTKFRVVSFKRK